MDESYLREHLEQADEHVARAKEQVARQKELIAELERTGHDATPAVSMLNALERGLHAFEQHREVILELLAQEIARKSGTP